MTLNNLYEHDIHAWTQQRADQTAVTYIMQDRITIDPAICHGKPCIRGMRYPVETVLELLASGMSSEAILADYEDLQPDDILAVLSFAARLTHIKRMDRLVA